MSPVSQGVPTSVDPHAEVAVTTRAAAVVESPRPRHQETRSNALPPLPRRHAQYAAILTATTAAPVAFAAARRSPRQSARHATCGALPRLATFGSPPWLCALSRHATSLENDRGSAASGRVDASDGGKAC